MWGVKPPQDPSAVLAATVASRFNLIPPVDIAAFAQQWANLEEVSWPFSSCDAMVVGLLNERPTIFLRAGLSPRRRLFTIGHEIGHILMGWHLGYAGDSLACAPSSDEFDIEPLAAVGRSGQSDSYRWQKAHEGEATRFASYVLAPEEFIRQAIDTGDMQEILRAVDQTGMSRQAGLIRLGASLQPGFCFAYRDRGIDHLTSSPGTELPDMRGGIDLGLLREMAFAWGQGTVGGKIVRWFRLTDYERPLPVLDARTTTELLRSAIRQSVQDPSKHLSIFQSMNGVAGGSLSNGRATSEEQVLALLRHKFRGRQEFGDVTKHPDFDLYLRRKAHECIENRARG